MEEKERESQQSTVDSLELKAQKDDRTPSGRAWDWLDQRGYTLGFWGKSAEDMGSTADRCDTENERVRKRLKRKRAENRDGEERERKCRRADIFRGMYPPVFA